MELQSHIDKKKKKKKLVGHFNFDNDPLPAMHCFYKYILSFYLIQVSVFVIAVPLVINY